MIFPTHTWPDWSDDEREELDKIFGAMSEKGTDGFTSSLYVDLKQYFFSFLRNLQY